MTQQTTLMRSVDARRHAAAGLGREQRSAKGQFLTPAPLAQLMAQQFDPPAGDVRLLDPGAGIGALTAAFVERIAVHPRAVQRCDLVAYEVEAAFIPHLEHSLQECCARLEAAGVPAGWELRRQDFLDAPLPLELALLSQADTAYTHVILNPPYRKIGNHSREHWNLSEQGIRTTNLYSAFVWKAMLSLEAGGELVAITPRSFCNGPYFRPFRSALLRELALDRIHLFESRTAAFSEDAVLQESIIFHAVRGAATPAEVAVTIIKGDVANVQASTRRVPYRDVVRPEDREQIIHIVENDAGQILKARMEALPVTLLHLGLDVSTGPVVDFRLKEHLLPSPENGSVPLLYPEALVGSRVVWPPHKARKPTALLRNAATSRWLTEPGCYVLTRRFTAKEEKRRVVAAVCYPLDAPAFGIENHLNYFHARGKGMDVELARGLAAFLNSSLVDDYFRQFSGHTQVNVSDLRRMRYPSRADLVAFGRLTQEAPPSQDQIDSWLQTILTGQARP